MNSTVVTIVVILVLVVALVGVVLALRRRGKLRSREESGAEYEREAEEELRGGGEEVGSRARPLSENSRMRYEEQWDEVERSFADDPVAALEKADRTVYDIMRERNFPVDEQDDSEETARDTGTAPPGIAGEYREARRIRYGVMRRGDGGEDQTEEMRQAIRRYRSVYERLTED